MPYALSDGNCSLVWKGEETSGMDIRTINLKASTMNVNLDSVHISQECVAMKRDPLALL